MAKYYFQTEDSVNCYDLTYFYNYMKMVGINEMQLIEAEREKFIDFFWCKDYNDIAERGECSKDFCHSYQPNNGKNGRCKHYGYLYSKTDKVKTIRLKK